MTGPPDELVAPDGEHPRRLARVRDRMRAGSLAALLVTDPANLYYLTGYDAWSFYTPQCLVVPADGEPVCFLRAMDANGARFAGTITPDGVEGYPEALVHQPDRHPFDWIARRVRERELLGPEPRTGKKCASPSTASTCVGTGCARSPASATRSASVTRPTGVSAR